MKPVYAIRLTAAARDFIDEQHSWMKTFTGKEAADTWRMDILKATCISAVGVLPATASCSPSMKTRTIRPSSASSLFYTAQAPMTQWPADDDEDADE